MSEAKPHTDTKSKKSKQRKKNCYLQTWGQYKSISGDPHEVLNVDLQGHAIYNVFAGENHTFFFTMKSELMGFGDDTFGQLTGEEKQMVKSIVKKPIDEVDIKYEESRSESSDKDTDTAEEEDITKLREEKVNKKDSCVQVIREDFVQFPRMLKINEKIEISKIICGSGFSFCIDNFQNVFSWGLNNKGQLGQGHKNNLTHPTLIRTLVSPDCNTIREDSGTKTSTHGTFSTQSKETEGPLGRLMGKYVLQKGEVVTDIACGGSHTVVLTSKNRIMTCGYGESGALGHQDSQAVETTFREVEGLTRNLKKKYPKETEGLELQIKTGVSHSCCLVFNRLFVWGLFGDKDLGQFSWTPTEINITFEIADFECGDMLTVFLSTTGEVYTIGNWKLGCLGLRKDKIHKISMNLMKERNGKRMTNSKSGSIFNRKRSASPRHSKKSIRGIRKEIFTPIEIKLNSKISQIAIGSRHVFALNQHAGKIYVWGDNSWGQCLPYSKAKLIWEPARVEFLNECGSFVILCRGNNSFLISRKVIQGTNQLRYVSLDQTLDVVKTKSDSLTQTVEQLKIEAGQLQDIRKDLKEELQRKNRQLEKVRMTTREEDFVDESGISMEVVENDYKWEINKIIRSFKKELSEDRTLKPHCEIDFKELLLGDKISEGGFGLIHKAKWRDTLVAVKIMKQELMKKELIKDFLSKINQMSVTSWKVSDTLISSCSWGLVPNCLTYLSFWSTALIKVFGICCIVKRLNCLGANEGELH